MVLNVASNHLFYGEAQASQTVNLCAELGRLICVLAGMLASPSWAGVDSISILGRWRMSDERPGQATKKSFARLEFLPGGKVVGLEFMAGVFSGGGEVLESGYGHYRIGGSFLSVRSPKRVDSDGWPGHNEVYGSTYRCGLVMDAASTSLTLSNCPLSGTWTREVESHAAPQQ